jgi:tRNA G37 N-methylase TrmD
MIIWHIGSHIFVAGDITAMLVQSAVMRQASKMLF